MLQKTICVLCSMLLSFSAFAAQIELFAQIEFQSEFDEFNPKEAKSSGWIYSEDDESYSLELKIQEEDLPVRKTLGPISLSLSKTGLVEVGISIGDQDASSEASIQLPVKNKKLVPISNIILSSSGGDHASGVWGYNSTIKLSIKK